MAARRRRLPPAAVAAVAAFFVLGLPDFAHGVAWPAMRSELHRALGDLGWLIVVFTAGYLIVASTTGWVQSRWGLPALIAASAAMAGGGLVVVAAAPSWGWVAGGFLLHGGGSGGLDAGINAHVALHHHASTMGYVHAAYGVGAAAGPIVVRATAGGEPGWRGAYAVLACAHLVALALALTRTRMQAEPARRPVEAAGEAAWAKWGPVVFFLYVAAEVGIGQWAYVSLTEHHGLSPLLAAAAVSGYWGGLTVGRIWLGAIGHRLDAHRVLAVATSAALVGVIALNAGTAWAALALPPTGLALSVVFPLLMQLTPERVGDRHAAAHIGWQAAAGALGGAAGPATMGVVLDRAGSDWYAPAALVLTALFAAAMYRGVAEARPRQPGHSS